VDVPRAHTRCSYYHIPSNISCVVDLLEDKGISWATYQENMPTDAFYGEEYDTVFVLCRIYCSCHNPSFDSSNYLLDDSEDEEYTFFVRKHNPLGIFDSVSQNETRAPRIRNFNDFANDVVNGTLPQWMFITPNMVSTLVMSIEFQTNPCA